MHYSVLPIMSGGVSCRADATVVSGGGVRGAAPGRCNSRGWGFIAVLMQRLTVAVGFGAAKPPREVFGCEE
jgi:hypothetical protein